MNHVLFTCTIARQSWALCNFPTPENGFDPFSIYSNIFFVLKMGNNQNCLPHIRRSGPWIIWSIWKNSNYLLFKGSLSVGQKFVNSIFEEVEHWFLIKEMESHDKAIDIERKKRIIFGWKPPPLGWSKCDIASSWNKNRSESGASWILRNSSGKVMLHGRRSFTNICNKLDAAFESWKWAIESMKSLRINFVIFSSEDLNLVGAIKNPSSWPSLKFYYLKLSSMLQELVFWKVESQSRFPFWLRQYFT